LGLLLLAFQANAAAESQNSVELPPYAFKYSNGLYGTLVGYFSIKEIELKNLAKYKLDISSFRKKVPVKAIVQSEPAPLVVIILGLEGKVDDSLGRVWSSWLSEAGYHVLSFDSTFLPSFIDISGHGVTGNLVAESERVRDIIGAFVALPEMHGKITKIGVAGMSYGGIQAMVLGQMAKEGRLGQFQIDAIQAYCPPLKLHKTGELIDRWFAEDRWKFKLTELASQMEGHKPVAADVAPPFSDPMIRAALSAIFRQVLTETIVRNDNVYHLGALPHGNNYDDQYVKKAYAETWGFGKFMRDISFPYWQKKLNLQSINELTDPVEIENLIEKQPLNSELILAEDDPLNDPADMASLKLKASGKRITFLAHGGHLGFVNEAWTKAKLLSLFNNASAPTKAP